MNVSVFSRQAIESVIRIGDFPPNPAVISFYDPPDTSPEGYHPVDYSNVTDAVFYAAVSDLDWDAFEDDPVGLQAFFPEAGAVADFILQAHRNGQDLICQCDYGQSRSAGCAMAIREFFDHAGKEIFADPRYYPNQLVFGKVLTALRAKNKNAL